jgi:LemA protein
MEPYTHPIGGPGTAPPGFPGPRAGAARWIGPILAIALLLLPAGLAAWAHNEMLGRAEAVDAAWAQVESNLQRRADLVPRLVETVSRYARHESELLMEVAHERAGAQGAAGEALEELGRAQNASTGLRAVALRNEGSLQALSDHEAAVGRGVRAVLAVAESYPELRSADQFLELQAQLEGSENRINVARMAFNDAVRAYNAALVQLPTRLVGQAMGLERAPYFKADEGARAAGPLGFE